MVSQRSGGARTTRGRTPDETADQTTDQSHATNERHAEVEALQRSAGNRATALLLARGQAKLRVGASDDRFEREADDMAARVVRALGGRGPSANETANDADGGGSSEGVQRRALVGEAGGDLDASTESMIARARQGGESLAPAVRRTMETTIGADFGGVRLHTGDAADALNEQVQARAFTIGNDIFFHGGAPDVGSAAGQELLAHELTHTVQQGASALRRTTDTVSLDAAPALQRKSGGKGKGKPKKKGGRGKGGGGGGGGSPVTFTAIEEPTFGEAEGAPSETEEVAAEETVVEETAAPETAAPETAAPETAAPKKLGKRARATANAKARAEAEAKAQAEAAATKKAEEDAAALAAQEAAAKKKAEEEAAAKDLFVKNGKVTKDKMNAAKTAAAPYFYIDVAHLTEMSKSIDDGLAVPVPVYADLAATLKRLYDASVKVLELVPWAAAGRLNKNGAKILVQKPTAISGDGGKNEQAAVKECIDAIGGVGTWNGTCANGDPGKWGVQHGNAEGNLPPGGYKEYYVRAPAGVGGPGRRRIVVHNATGRMYYSWTHYGDNGNPPFVLLRA